MSLIGQIKEKITGYAAVYIKLWKADFILRTSNVLSYLMFALVGIFLLFCVVLFLGLGLSEWFADMGLTRACGSFIVVGIYILLLIVLVLCRKPVTRFFASGVVRAITEGDEEDKEEDDE